MRTFDYFNGLRLEILLLRHNDDLSASLQTRYLCAAEAQTIAKHTVAALKKMRTGENCHLFWEDVKQKIIKSNADALKLSKKQTAPTRIEEIFGGKSAAEYDDDVIFHCRRIYFESLDCINNTKEDQFDQEDFKIYERSKVFR